jgi:hypothetical protein
MLSLSKILAFYSLATFKDLRSYLNHMIADTPKITKHSDYDLELAKRATNPFPV